MPKLLSDTVAPAIGASGRIGEDTASALRTAQESYFQGFPWARRTIPLMRRGGITEIFPGEPTETDAINSHEQRVAVRAAQGASNRATGLSFSVGARAFEQQLTSSYPKLGILGCRRLAVAVRERPGVASKGLASCGTGMRPG